MTRDGSMFTRAARVAARALPDLPRANGTDSHDSYAARCTCPYCGKHLETILGRDRHITLQPFCRARHQQALSSKKGCERKRKMTEDEPPRKRMCIEVETPPVAGPSKPPIYDPKPTTRRAVDTNAERGERHASNGTYVEPFPISTAGTPIGTRRREDADLRDYLRSCGSLGDRDSFETAEILMTMGLTGSARTRHLNGPVYKGKGLWKNDPALLKDVDKLPMGLTWTPKEIPVGEGLHRRTHTLYFRDILEVVCELISARRFKHCMKYAPERHWTSKHGSCRAYDEMWSGDWWWRMQYLIRNKKGTVVPLIIASDETTLSNNAQGEKAHPIYLSIGNISKSVRRKPTKRAMIIIGYLPVDSFQGVPDEARRRYRAELLHRSLETIFEPLKTASSDGLLAWCADGYLLHIYPILAAWCADWPEQNDVAGMTQGGCPKCMQPWKGRGQGGPSKPLREQDASLEALRTYHRTKRPAVLKALRLRPVLPFWADIPHVDIGACMVPDLLHQLYKGMFEHVRDWVEDLLGTEEFNQRFKAMPKAQYLRHFKKGVTTVKVWAGRESREMMRQFLPVVIDAQAPPDFVRMVRALLDFSYLAHGAQLTDDDLTKMDEVLAAFHKAKRILVDMDMVPAPNSFDRMPKLHMLGHYPNDIRELGSPDGFSTETPEHLHIVYVKAPWRMSNRRNPIPQIVKFVKRIEVIEIQRTFIDEFYGERLGAGIEETDMYNDDCKESESEASEEDVSRDEDSDGEVVQPTAPKVSGHVLMTSYHAPDLIWALRRFLLPMAQRCGEDLIILPSDRFDVWHKVTLDHSLLPFARAQPCHRDVVRVCPILRDADGHVKDPGVFDSALFATSHGGAGLTNFRAGRVRAIFTLPPRFQHLHPGPLVYLEIFTPFVPDAIFPYIYRAAHAYSNETRASLVLPLTCLAMACHMAPNFSSLMTPARRYAVRTFGTVYAGRDFLFNDFYNYFTYILMAYWQRSTPAQPS